jgi:RNA polymerase sigma-70 factor (ECF subfamily)
MTDRTDRQLIASVLEGSSEAAAELFRRYWQSSWQAALAVVGREAAAEDVAQEAFQRAFRALPSFDRQRPFGPWLHRIVVNRALDVIRRERRLVTLDHSDNGTVDVLEERLGDQDLFTALARLDPGRRAIIALRYWLDYTPTEIADVLELPVGTVSSRLSRALSELRNELEEDHVYSD